MNQTLLEFYDKIIDAYYNHPDSDSHNESGKVEIVVGGVTASIEVFVMPADARTTIFYEGEKVLTINKGMTKNSEIVLEFEIHNEATLTAAVLSI